MKIILDFDPSRDIDGDVVLPAVVSRIRKGRSEQVLILDPVTVMTFDSERDAICYFVAQSLDVDEWKNGIHDWVSFSVGVNGESVDRKSDLFNIFVMLNEAQTLYDLHIESGLSFEMFARTFDRFELHFLWVDLCENGAAYDDEVYEALYDLGYFHPDNRPTR